MSTVTKTLLVIPTLALTALACDAATIVADYRADFGGPTLPTGWTYEFNSGLGDSANNTALTWNGARWQNGPAATPNFNANGGHPGAAGANNFAITGYTIQAGDPQALNYILNDGVDFGIRRNNLQGSAGADIDFAVYVNDALIDSGLITASGGQPGVHFFNGLDLGILSAGDTVYIGIGNGGLNDFDATSLDFSIAAVPEPGSLVVGVAGIVGLCLRRRR